MEKRVIRDDIRDTLNKVRMLQESAAQEQLSKGDAIAITDDPKFGQNTLSNQIEQFKASVESGAQFSKVDPNNVSECPLIYMPRTNNLVFSGIIPRLNNMKFQFVLKTSTGNGCFVWTDGLVLSKENIETINKLFGFYKNWREQWNMEAGDLERMAARFQNLE